jgi:TPR repeat protein
VRGKELRGVVAAHHSLAIMYHDRHGVEKDEKKKIYHWEEAAIGGHSWARHCLGNEEWDNGTIERAVKHWIIAANLGCTIRSNF